MKASSESVPAQGQALVRFEGDGGAQGHFERGRACCMPPECWMVFYEHFAFPVFEGFR
jgi:hypothetical protein